MDDPIPFSDSLDEVVSALRGPSRAAVGGVFGQWEEAVGPQVAGHVRPIKLDGDVLVVEVDDPAWATQVSFLGATLIERVATVTGVQLAKVVVRVAGSR